MYSAKQINNFIPQNPTLNAPRRIDVTLPIFQPVINANLGFPSANAVDGGIVYEETSLQPMNNAASYNSYNMMYPCIPQPNNNIVFKPPPIDDTNGYQAPYGYGRNQPKGIASLKKRDRLFAKELPIGMQTNSVIAPMMQMKAF